jgi:signal transduction histidine kinase
LADSHVPERCVTRNNAIEARAFGSSIVSMSRTVPSLARPPLLPRSALVWAAWTVWGLFVANQAYLVYGSLGVALERFWPPLVTALLPAWYWALATGPITRLAWHLPLRRGGLPVAIPAHLVAAVLACAGDVACEYGAFMIAGETLPRVSFLTSMLRQLHTNVLLYAAIVGVYELLRYQHLLREREVRAAQLETQLVKAQLSVLKMQIQPHFLFNTLNAISQLFHEDPDAAERMMAHLGDLLRITLEQGGEQEVALAHELDFLARYIDLQKVRFQDRLEVELDMPADLMDVYVPNLLLQPLVENAIKHGITRTDRGGRVRVSARRDGDRLVLEVRDNGPGPAPTFTRSVGLTNTDERIRQLYGSGGVTLSAAHPGTIATVEIPLRRGTHGTAGV